VGLFSRKTNVRLYFAGEISSLIYDQWNLPFELMTA